MTTVPQVLGPADHDLRDLLLTYAEAAEIAGPDVTTDVLRQWKRRGLLVPAAWTPDGRPRFHPRDVLAVERRTRQEVRRMNRPPRGTRRTDSHPRPAGIDRVPRDVPRDVTRDRGA